jgi:hypothetical protein
MAAIVYPREIFVKCHIYLLYGFLKIGIFER